MIFSAARSRLVLFRCGARLLHGLKVFGGRKSTRTRAFGQQVRVIRLDELTRAVLISLDNALHRRVLQSNTYVKLLHLIVLNIV